LINYDDDEIVFSRTGTKEYAEKINWDPYDKKGKKKIATGKDGKYSKKDVKLFEEDLSLDLEHIWDYAEDTSVPEPMTFGLAARKAQQFSVFD
jgi:hypothetical protein